MKGNCLFFSPADGGKYRELGRHEGASSPGVGGYAWAQDRNQKQIQEFPAHLRRPERPQCVQGEDPTNGGRYAGFSALLALPAVPHDSHLEETFCS